MFGGGSAFGFFRTSKWRQTVSHLALLDKWYLSVGHLCAFLYSPSPRGLQKILWVHMHPCCVYVSMGTHVCYGTHVEVRRQPLWVGSHLSPLHWPWASSSSLQICIPSAFTSWVDSSCWPFLFVKTGSCCVPWGEFRLFNLSFSPISTFWAPRTTVLHRQHTN